MDALRMLSGGVDGRKETREVSRRRGSKVRR